MVEMTWDQLEVPILEAVAELEDSDQHLGVDAVATHVGMSYDEAGKCIRRLMATDLLTGKELPSYADGYHAMGLRLLPHGRQIVGQWPSDDPLEAFTDLLAGRIAEEEDPTERGKLERLRDASGAVGQSVLTGLLTAFAQRAVGLG